MSDSARSAISATSLRIWFFVCSSRPGSMVSSISIRSRCQGRKKRTRDSRGTGPRLVILNGTTIPRLFPSDFFNTPSNPVIPKKWVKWARCSPTWDEVSRRKGNAHIVVGQVGRSHRTASHAHTVVGILMEKTVNPGRCPGYFFWASAKAESNSRPADLKPIRSLTNFAASAAPYSRSMPQSSHSTESGPS